MIQTIQTVETYDEALLYPAVCRSFDALGVAEDLRPGMRVVLKPNLIMARGPEAPVTTHPAVVGAVARWLLDHGVEDITVAESSGGAYTPEHLRRLYHVCGMDTLPEGVKLNLDCSAETVYCSAGFRNHSFHLITPIVRADYIINLCKLKTHSMTGYSGGIKNLFGTIPGLEKPQMHYRWPDLEDFSRMLLELAQTVSPQVTVVDAIDAMEGNGPTGGTSHPLHLLLAARDFYTQDYFAAGLMGLDPLSIAMIRQAAEQGLAHPEAIELAGGSVPENLMPFKKPDAVSIDFSNKVPSFLRRPFTAMAARLLKSYPQLQRELCVGCGKCAESCPAHVITIENKKAVFRRKGCISCFCCQEMCPMKAIAVRKAL